MALADIFALFHKGKHRYPLGKDIPGGYNPVMVQRPMIGAGNTGRYFLDAFQLPAQFSIAGGGTLPRGNPPGLPRNALAVTPQSVVDYGGMGSIPNVPKVGQGLVRGFRSTL